MVKYTKEVLEKAAKKSESIAGIMREMGVEYISGGLHTHISKQLKRFGVDTSHFSGQSHNKNRTARNKLTPEEIFVLRPEGTRQRHSLLKRALLESGVPYVCSLCQQDPYWEDQELTLPIDHINGNPLDNRKENLRFVCPNCHSQQVTSCTSRRHN